MNKMQKQVQAFHEAFGHTVNDQPRSPSIDDIKLRILLMQEELLGKGELAESMENQDLIGVADGLADLLYVTIGTAVVFGIDIEPVFDEVHRSNMSKLGDDGEPIISRGMDIDGYPLGKVMKGPNFFEPAIGKELNKQTTSWSDLKEEENLNMPDYNSGFCGNPNNHDAHDNCGGAVYVEKWSLGDPFVPYRPNDIRREMGLPPAIIDDPVKIVKHYGPGDYEVANFVQAHDLGAWAMNVVKYVTRAGKKGDTDELKRAKALEDVEKAAAYLQMLHNGLSGKPAIVRDPETQEIRWTLFKN